MIGRCGIYGIHNVANGKWYIGQSVEIELRRRIHFSRLRNSSHYNSHLQSAFKEYGSENFEFRMLEEVAVEMLDIRERAWIAYYKSDQKEFGYNKTTGGWTNKKLSTETKLKLAAINTGTHRTMETRRKMSIAHQGVSRKPFSEEHKRRLSQARIGKRKVKIIKE